MTGALAPPPRSSIGAITGQPAATVRRRLHGDGITMRPEADDTTAEGRSPAQMHCTSSGTPQVHPEITGQVFDLPHVVGGASKAAADAGLGERFHATGGDFFAGPLPAADYYLLKWVLHDWDDAQCVSILRNVRASAAPGSRMLVVEAVVGEVGTPDAAAIIDINMLVSTNGQERDFAELDALFESSGWKRIAASPSTPPQFMIEVEAT